MESCVICGGDGRISNAFGGSSKTCPSCHGTGRRAEGSLLRDVTKTKPSHHRQPNKGPVAVAEQGPSTLEGVQLANTVQASATVSAETKARLVQEIIEYEGSHGRCTQTFIKKIKKLVRPAIG